MHKYQKSCSKLIWLFYCLLLLFKQKYHKDSSLREFCAQVSQIVFLADLTVLRLIKTVWAKISQNLYLREFYAQVSQSVFLADLTVLRFVTTVWAKLSQNSYVQEFCSQVSKTVLLADLTVLQLVRTVWAKLSSKLISPRVLCRSIIYHVLSWFDRFYGLLVLCEQKSHKTHISASSVHK